MTPSQKAGILAEALPYLRAFHGKTIVVRFGGQAMADQALKAGFARDVSLLRLVGMKIVVVHGGGWGIDALMRKMGLEAKRYRGHRITDERTLTIVEMALSELNQELTSLINREGGRAVGLDGQDGRFIHARPMAAPADDPDAPDLGFLGDVESIDTDAHRASPFAQFRAGGDADRRGGRQHDLPHQFRPAGRPARARARSGKAGADDQRRRRARS